MISDGKIQNMEITCIYVEVIPKKKGCRSKMLKTLLVSLLAVAALALPTATANATAADNAPVVGRTWLYNNGWTLVNAQGQVQTGWFNAGTTANPEWLLFNNAGRLQLGWQQVGNQWFFLENRSAVYTDADNNINRGTMRTGAITIGAQNFYLTTPTTTNNGGAMRTGWVNSNINGVAGYRLYHSRGHQLFGWQRVNGSWFYLPEGTRAVADGARVGNVNRNNANAIVEVTSAHAGMYLFHYGAMQTGWINVGGGNYRFATSNGRLQVNRWQRAAGHWYLLGTDGLMVRGTAGATNGGFHRVVSGTATHPGLYFFLGNGRMQTGWFSNAGHDFHASASGLLSYNTWVTTRAGNRYRLNGPEEITSTVGPNNTVIPPFAMLHSGTFTIGTVNYTFAPSGRVLGTNMAPEQGPGTDMQAQTNLAWCNAFARTTVNNTVVANLTSGTATATVGGICTTVTTVTVVTNLADDATFTVGTTTVGPVIVDGNSVTQTTTYTAAQDAVDQVTVIEVNTADAGDTPVWETYNPTNPAHEDLPQRERVISPASPAVPARRTVITETTRVITR